MSEENTVVTEEIVEYKAPAAAAEEPSPAAESEAETPEAVENKEETSGEEKEAEAKKPEKTEEQREIDRLRRGLERQRQRRSDERAARELAERRAEELAQRLQLSAKSVDSQEDSAESDLVSLPRAEFSEMVRQEAERLAPTLAEQRARVEQRRAVVDKLESSLGKEKFDELAEGLSEALDGLEVSKGVLKPAVEALFEADNPAAVLNYLGDPEHADEAEKLSGMTPMRAAAFIAKLEVRLAAEKPAARKSSAATPVTPIKPNGGVRVARDPANMTDAEWYAAELKADRERRRA